MRAEWPPFSALPGIWLAPFFSTKSIWMTRFFLDSYVKDPIFLTGTRFAQRFFDAAYSPGITWINCYICLNQPKKWVQKIKRQYMNRSTFWMIKYMNGSVFSKASYMNGVGFEILARTPLPKLSLSYLPPPPPPSPTPQSLNLLSKLLYKRFWCVFGENTTLLLNNIFM